MRRDLGLRLFFGWNRGECLLRCLGERYAVSFRAGVHRDAGMVPLSARETAKGEEQATQLAALRQVLPVLQRSHPRAKRKPDPRIMHTSPEAHRWVTRDAKKDTKKVGKIIKKYLQGKLTYDIVKKLILCTSADSASGA